MNHRTTNKTKGLVFLSLAALGVVYGDIGTSPLYAVNELFFGHGRVTQSSSDILGGISMILWAVTLLISLKYILLVLKANSKGEGGVFALYSIINKVNTKSKWILMGLLIMAAGLLFGDGMITPAISVMSSVEGLSVATHAFTPYIIPLTILILTGLFFIQRKGTAKLGIFFGPIIIVWFLTIAFFGAITVMQYPQILLAINPYYGIHFFFTHTLIDILFALGAVMLSITGGEAMYADLGHFGAIPIRISWFSIVYPALLLNYMGQGAYLLSGKPIINGNIFFSMLPHLAIYPMVILATVATIIASQALLAGAFSIASQGISLGLFPYFHSIHTHAKHRGQIYVPFVNGALYVGCIMLVLIFHSSNNLAAAYGIAVSGDMFITSLSMITIALDYWKWKKLLVYALFVPILFIDTAFLGSNSIKIIEGGYIPLGIGFSLFIIMRTWIWGRNKIKHAFNDYTSYTVEELIQMKKESTYSIPKTIIIMSPKPILHKDAIIPRLKQLFIERYGILPFNIIFLTVNQEKTPYIDTNRFEIKTFLEDVEKGSITGVMLNFGFMEDPNVEIMLKELAERHELNITDDPSTWLIHIIQERPRLDEKTSLLTKFRFAIFMFLSKNTDTADIYFGLGKENHLTSEILPVVIT